MSPRGEGSADLGGDPYACDKETERYLGDRSDKVPNMDLKTMAAEELNDERDETMMPSTDTIAGPTATAFTLAMEGPPKCPQTTERNDPLSNSLHTSKATSPILETPNPIHFQN